MGSEFLNKVLFAAYFIGLSLSLYGGLSMEVITCENFSKVG